MRAAWCVFAAALSSQLCLGVVQVRREAECLNDSQADLIHLDVVLEDGTLAEAEEEDEVLECFAEDVTGPTEQCPAGSYVFTASAQAWHLPRTDFTRVVMADYPSTGSTWLKKLVTAAAGTVKGCVSPACSTYKREGPCQVASGVYCPCSQKWTAKQGAVLFKTHYPTRALYRGESLSGTEREKAMHFDKILLLTRHPVATVNSGVRRWPGEAQKRTDNLRCWGEWWRRAAEEAGAENVLMMKYEDLCLHTASSVYKVMQFLGGCYAQTSEATIRRMLKKTHRLDCKHQGELSALSTPKTASDHYAVDMLSELLAYWGYDSDAVAGKFY